MPDRRGCSRGRSPSSPRWRASSSTTRRSAPSSASSDPLPGRSRSTELASTGRCAISRSITPLAGWRMASTSTGSERSASRREPRGQRQRGPVGGGRPGLAPGALIDLERSRCPRGEGGDAPRHLLTDRGHREDDRVDQVDAVGAYARTGGRRARQGWFGAPDRCWACGYPLWNQADPDRGSQRMAFDGAGERVGPERTTFPIETGWSYYSRPSDRRGSLTMTRDVPRREGTVWVMVGLVLDERARMCAPNWWRACSKSSFSERRPATTTRSPSW